MRFAFLPLGVWIGAMLATVLAAFRVFGALDDDSVAGDIMAGMFRLVDSFGLIATLLAGLVCWRDKIRLGLAALLWGGTAANLFWIAPKIAEEGGRGGYHKASETLWACLLVGAVILALLGPPKPKQG